MNCQPRNYVYAVNCQPDYLPRNLPMDHCSQPGLLPVDAALERMLNQLCQIQETETVPLAAALDRILADTVIAPINVPAGDNSAMDGYALRADDCAGQLRIIGQSFAGHPFNGELGAGEAVRIMTGALIPAGADTVVMQENTRHSGDVLTINQLPGVGENIRRAGEDIPLGAELLLARRAINALDIGLLASVGCASVKVIRKLRIALLTTGDELLVLGTAPQSGKIYDSNRPLLAALLQRLPIELLDLGIIPDDSHALRAAFTRASDWADVVISTGGVSVGDADYTRDVLAELGAIDFWRIAMKPGKPFAFGRLGQGWFFGLPGNPVSTAVTYHQLVVPALRHLAGEKTLGSPRILAQAVAALKKQPGRTDFQRGLLSCEQGTNRVVSVGSQSSGVLSSMAKANCFICLEQERGAVEAGEQVSVIPFDQFIR
jgi:molybdopterin molybdotransferase